MGATFQSIRVGGTFRFPKHEFADDFGVCRKVSARCYLYQWRGGWYRTQVGSVRVPVLPEPDDAGVPTRASSR